MSLVAAQVPKAPQSTSDIVIPINLELLQQHQQQIISQLQPNMQVRKALANGAVAAAAAGKVLSPAALQISSGKLQLVQFVLGTPIVQQAQQQQQQELKTKSFQLVQTSDEDPKPTSTNTSTPAACLTSPPPPPLSAPSSLPPESPLQDEEASPQRKCTICDLTLSNKAQFNAHIKAHLKEKLTKRKRDLDKADEGNEDKSVVESPQKKSHLVATQAPMPVAVQASSATFSSATAAASPATGVIHVPKHLLATHGKGGRMMLVTTMASAAQVDQNKSQESAKKGDEKMQLLLPLQTPVQTLPAPVTSLPTTALATSTATAIPTSYKQQAYHCVDGRQGESSDAISRRSDSGTKAASSGARMATSPSSTTSSDPLSEEREMNRLDFHKDISSLLDQIEQDFESPGLSGIQSLEHIPPSLTATSGLYQSESRIDLLGFDQFVECIDQSTERSFPAEDDSSSRRAANKKLKKSFIKPIVLPTEATTSSKMLQKAPAAGSPGSYPKKTGIQCAVCSKSFSQKSHLRRHEKRSGHGFSPNSPASQPSPAATPASSTLSSPKSSLVCKVCNKTCKNRVSLIRHRSRHLACTFCAQVFDNKVALQDHLLKTHPKAAILSVEMNTYCSGAVASASANSQAAAVGASDELPKAFRAGHKADSCLSSTSLSLLLKGDACGEPEDEAAALLKDGEPGRHSTFATGSHYSDSSSSSSTSSSSPSPSASPAARESKCSSIAEISDTSFFFDFPQSLEDEQDFLYSTDLFQT